MDKVFGMLVWGFEFGIKVIKVYEYELVMVLGGCKVSVRVG